VIISALPLDWVSGNFLLDENAGAVNNSLIPLSDEASEYNSISSCMVSGVYALLSH
jgi:hypothetical protein